MRRKYLKKITQFIASGKDYIKKYPEKIAFFIIFTFLLIGILFQSARICMIFNAVITKYKWQETFYILNSDYYRKHAQYKMLRSGMSGQEVFNFMIEDLRVKKTCKNAILEGCWPVNSYFVDGSPVGLGPVSPGFKLYNGVLVSYIFETNKKCDFKKICSVISIDLNGLIGPNTFGKDQFRVYYYQDKIIPYHPSEDKLVGTLVKNFLNIK
ncbi:MAG: hypothetical protein V2B14_03665 [bacterium]